VITASWARVRRTRGSRIPEPKLPTRCAVWSSSDLYQAVELAGRRSRIPTCTRSSRGVAAVSLANREHRGFRSRMVADACGAPVLRDQGPIGRPGTARPMQASSGTAGYLAATYGPQPWPRPRFENTVGDW
jgi:hypothetical protein